MRLEGPQRNEPKSDVNINYEKRVTRLDGKSRNGPWLWGRYCDDKAYADYGDGVVLKDDGSRPTRFDGGNVQVATPFYNVSTNASANTLRCTNGRFEYFPPCSDTIDRHTVTIEPLMPCARQNLSQRVRPVNDSHQGNPFIAACGTNQPCEPVPNALYVIENSTVMVPWAVFATSSGS